MQSRKKVRLIGLQTHTVSFCVCGIPAKLTSKPSDDKETARKYEKSILQMCLRIHLASIPGQGGFILSKMVGIVLPYCTVLEKEWYEGMVIVSK
jgi:hypothetical protein